MKVLLVEPPFHAFFEYDKWWFSYATAQLAASLHEKGIEAYVYDADKYFPVDVKTRNRLEMVRRQDWYFSGVKNDNHYIWNHFRKVLNDIKPDVVGIDSYACKMFSTEKMFEICKQVNPNIKTCVGGPHVSAAPEDFKNNKYVDAVFVGLSEGTLPEWILNGCKENYITFDPNKYDVRTSPMPRRESFLFPEYFTPSDMGTVMFSRGCSFDCSFCSNRFLYGKKFQFRPPESIRAEIEHLMRTYGTKNLFLLDANFLNNPKKAMEVAEIIKSYGLSWSFEGRIDMITEPFLEKLIDCGCNSIAFGIEGGSDESMENINKKLTIDQILKSSLILNKYKFDWKCFFIVGFPGETLEDMDQTRKFALSLDASYISLNAFTPYPGSKNYNDLVKENSDIAHKIYTHNQLNPTFSFNKGISNELYKEKFSSILNDFERHNEQKKLSFTKTFGNNTSFVNAN